MPALKDRPQPSKNGKAAHPASVAVTLPAHQYAVMVVPLVGTDPLLQSSYADATKAAQLAGQLGLPPVPATKKRSIDELGQLAAYWIDPAAEQFGHPGEAFKRAIWAAAKLNADRKLPSTRVMGGLFIRDTVPTDQGDLLPLECTSHRVRTDSAVNQKTKDRIVAVRMELTGWSIEVPIEYNESLITPDQIMFLLNLAGMSVGVGAWRPEKGGRFGRFQIGR